ncbi:MAG: UvrD-helicase domain-containing protein [bacterium]|nr:UvrD-helicase domain-containing protein [bacterium]
MSDAEAREAAVREYDLNVVVVAGAGTGKTSLLVERVLNQMIETDLSATEFAAITFTEKAAAEMRIRLENGLERLLELARERRPAAELDLKREADRAYGYLCERVSADTLLNRAESRQAELTHASISTVHGYCASLLRQFPLESGVDPDFSVDDGLQFDSLRNSLWHEFLSSSYGPDGESSELWTSVMKSLDLAEIQALAFELSSFSLPSLTSPLLELDTVRVLAPLIEEQLEKNDDAFDGEPSNGPEKFLSTARPVLRVLLDNGLDAFRIAIATTLYDGGRKPRTLTETTPPRSKKNPEAEDCAKETSSLLRSLVQVDDALIKDVIRLATPFGALVRSEAIRRNILPFDALLRLTRDMLARNPLIRRILGERYRTLFLDEFQDTDPLQYEIVFHLAEQPLEGPGPADTDPFAKPLTPGKLFIVGDPKQAIYRFRGADIRAYQRAVRHILDSGGRQLKLTTSWRALPEILDPLDRLFPSLLKPGAADEQDAYSGYETLESGRNSAHDGPRIEVWTVGDTSLARRAETARRSEADAIADWIATEARAGRKSPGEVALLFRSLANLQTYTRAMAASGVAFSVEAGGDLLERPEGQQLWALLRALANPGDAPAVLGVLRSPFGGATDRELAAFSRAGGSWTYVLEDPIRCEARDEFPNVTRTLDWLERTYQRVQDQPIDAVLCEIIRDSSLLPLQAVAGDGIQRISFLRGVLDPLVELARAEPEHTLRSLILWLERGNMRRRRGTPGEGNTVRIMSIHAAKGLEFPTVILPDLGRSAEARGRKAGPLAQTTWLPDLGTFAIETAAGSSSTWLVQQREERRHETAESKRLFYVACTRAQENLILVHAPRKNTPKNAVVQYLQPWGYPLCGLSADEALANMPGVLTKHMSETSDIVLEEPPGETIDVHTAISRARSISASVHESLRVPFRSATGIREEREAELEQPDGSPPSGRMRNSGRGSSVAREVGDLIHQLLERWDFSDPGMARVILDDLIAAENTRQPGQAKALRREATETLEALLASDLPEYLRGVEVIARELPILFLDSRGVACSGTLDLLHMDPDGHLVISDYKTDRQPDPASRERYRTQLETYAEGIQRAFPDHPAPTLELIYVRTGERVRLQERTIAG